MNDIVERLRYLHGWLGGLSLYADAADEIEALRAKLREQALNYLSLDGQATELIEENERLRAALKTGITAT